MAIATPRWNIDLANPGDAVYVGRADTVLVRVLRDQGFADRRILAVFALYGRALTLAVNCLTTVAKLLLPGGADAVVDVGEKEMKNRKFAQWTRRAARRRARSSGLAFQRAAAAAAAYEHRFLRIRFGTPSPSTTLPREPHPLEGDELRGAFVEAYQILCAHPAVRIAVLDDVDA
eukprot:tig00021072_g17961.t1